MTVIISPILQVHKAAPEQKHHLLGGWQITGKPLRCIEAKTTEYKPSVKSLDTLFNTIYFLQINIEDEKVTTLKD